MPEATMKGVYGCFVAAALLIMLVGAPRAFGISRVATAKVKKDASVRSGSTHRTRYVYIGGFGGK